MTTQPTLPDLLPDAAWLARVREDAGRWWASFEPALGTALVLTSDPYGGWYVRLRSGWPASVALTTPLHAEKSSKARAQAGDVR